MGAVAQNAVQRVLDEYYEAFGPAADAVRAYFNLYKTVSENASREDSAYINHVYAVAGNVFTPAVMAQARSLMAAAQAAASGDADASAKVAFLEKGLTSVELTLAAQEAWDAYQAGGPLANWTAALLTMDNYRASIEDDFVSDMGFLFIGKPCIGIVNRTLK